MLSQNGEPILPRGYLNSLNEPHSVTGFILGTPPSNAARYWPSVALLLTRMLPNLHLKLRLDLDLELHPQLHT